MQFRKAARDDMFRVLELLREGASADNPTYPAFLGGPKSDKAHLVVAKKTDAGLIEVAVKDDQVVGIIVMTVDQYVWNQQILQDAMFVYLTPSARGEDGFEMIDRVTEIARERNLPTTIMIHEHDRTKAHIDLFERRGWNLHGYVMMCKPMEKRDE